MRILQITDIHINRLNELTKEVNVIDNFLNVLEEGCLYHPDLIVLSGDLGHNDVQTDVYQWIKEKMAGRGVPYRIIGGNHDDFEKMAKVFADVQGFLPYFTYLFDNHKIVFLNTIEGGVDSRQLEWLREELKEEVSAIFMHHPPLLSGIPHMDVHYAMHDRDEFLELFASMPKRIRIFTGHYHTERTVEAGNVSVYITPSTFVQISDKSVDFMADHYKPAYRMIQFEEGVFKTWVRYLGM